MNGQHSLSQERAKQALRAVEALQGQAIGHYVSYVKALPANILQNGLGQALAMLLAAAADQSDNDPHRRLYNQMQCWLCRTALDAPYSGECSLIQAIAKGDERKYIHAHAEALAYLVWLKKFAVAFLEKSGGETPP